jgi:hypothetical protein
MNYEVDVRGDGAPGLIRVFNEGEFRQDDVGAATADGVRLAPARQSHGCTHAHGV